MNRRSVLRWLGLAPVAAPAAVAAASSPLVTPAEGGAPRFKSQPFVIEVRQDGASRFVSPADAAHAEAWNHATADTGLSERIDRALAGRFG